MCEGVDGRWYLVSFAFAYTGNCGQNVNLNNRLVSYNINNTIEKLTRRLDGMCKRPNLDINEFM